MRVRLARADDEVALGQLIAAFRRSLAELRGGRSGVDIVAAREELAEYRERDFPVYVATDDGGALLGYLVCRVEGKVVWAESLYVVPETRRQGVGAALYARAERLAEERGGDTVYNWVDPNNAAIIGFLQGRGYTVLNLIELRRARPDEQAHQTIRVGRYEFDR